MRWALSVMVKIRGMSKAENFLMGVNGFGHCLTLSSLASFSESKEK